MKNVLNNNVTLYLLRLFVMLLFEYFVLAGLELLHLANIKKKTCDASSNFLSTFTDCGIGTFGVHFWNKIMLSKFQIGKMNLMLWISMLVLSRR